MMSPCTYYMVLCRIWLHYQYVLEFFCCTYTALYVIIENVHVYVCASVCVFVCMYIFVYVMFHRQYSDNASSDHSYITTTKHSIKTFVATQVTFNLKVV